MCDEGSLPCGCVQVDGEDQEPSPDGEGRRTGLHISHGAAASAAGLPHHPAGRQGPAHARHVRLAGEGGVGVWLGLHTLVSGTTVEVQLTCSIKGCKLC